MTNLYENFVGQFYLVLFTFHRLLNFFDDKFISMNFAGEQENIYFICVSKLLKKTVDSCN